MPWIQQLKSWNKLRKARRNKPKVYYFPGAFAYIPIPKCATRSMYDLLRERAQREGGEDFEKFARYIPQKDIGVITTSHYTFSIVRHPVERVYSAYKNKVLSGEGSARKNIFEKHGIPRNISFAEFVERISQIPDAIADRHFRSQTWYLRDGDKLLGVDLVKLENMAQDWKRVEEKTGLVLPAQLNRSREARLPQLDERTRELLRKRYRQDLDLLGYSF